MKRLLRTNEMLRMHGFWLYNKLLPKINYIYSMEVSILGTLKSLRFSSSPSVLIDWYSLYSNDYFYFQSNSSHVFRSILAQESHKTKVPKIFTTKNDFTLFLFVSTYFSPINFTSLPSTLIVFSRKQVHQTQIIKMKNSSLINIEKEKLKK